ncbi:MAG: hypothetical protein L6427_06620 [Actinomycetia bacterium]|nr:hypothetical protein [Actinomycetes bacterium]
MLDKRNSEEIDIPAEPVRQLNAGPPAPPPFLSPAKEGGAARRWWHGLTKQSKIGVLMTIGAFIAVVSVSWIASAAANGGANRAALVDGAKDLTPIATTSRFTESVYMLGFSALAFRLEETASNASGTTLELLTEMPYLSRATGGKDIRSRSRQVTSLPLAGAGRASGTGETRESAGEDTVNGGAELIRNGNRIAEQYVPLYQAYQGEVTAICEIVKKVDPPEEFKASYDLLLEACVTLSRAISESIQGLELLRDTSREKVLRSDRAVQESSRLIYEGTEYLNQAVALLPLQ